MKNQVITASALCCVLGLASSGGTPQDPSLEETRVLMGKWIETQQIISKERNEWQQGRDVLQARLELVRKEASTLDQGIREAQARIADTETKRNELLAESARLEALQAQLLATVETLEGELRKLHPSLPEPIAARIGPLYERMPADDAGKQRVSVAERFQNVLGILNELNKASGDITINFEVRTLEGGKPSEVKVIYVGLTQAYFVDGKGEAGIGRPTPSGWKWESSKTISDDVLMSLDILQGKHTPAFVPLPVKFQ